MGIPTNQYYELLLKLEKYKSNTKYRIYAVFGLVVLIIFLFVGSCNRISNLKNNLTISEQNIKSLSDSVRVSKNKVGDLESSINILVTTKKELLNLSVNLGEELKKEKGKVSQLNEYIASFKPETLLIPNEVVVYEVVDGDKLFGLAFKYDTIFDKNNYLKLEVESKFKIDTNFNVIPLNSIVKNNEVGFSLITGLRELDGNIEIFARSNHPYLKISSMEGAIIDPKNHPILKKFTTPKKFHVGPYIGVGLGGDLRLGIQLGIGITYSMVRF